MTSRVASVDVPTAWIVDETSHAARLVSTSVADRTLDCLGRETRSALDRSLEDIEELEERRRGHHEKRRVHNVLDTILVETRYLAHRQQLETPNENSVELTTQHASRCLSTAVMQADARPSAPSLPSSRSGSQLQVSVVNVVSQGLSGGTRRPIGVESKSDHGPFDQHDIRGVDDMTG